MEKSKDAGGKPTNTKRHGEAPQIDVLVAILRLRHENLALDKDQQHGVPTWEKLAEMLSISLNQVKSAWTICKGADGSLHTHTAVSQPLPPQG